MPHKRLLLIFLALTGIGFVPFAFFSLFTHWYAYTLIFWLLDLSGFNPSHIGTMEYQLVRTGLTIPILVGYSLLLAVWINYVFSQIGGTRHRTAIALSIALVAWMIMPFVISGIVNGGSME
jgi:hypothetical protein